jgi:hypothetical protein
VPQGLRSAAGLESAGLKTRHYRIRHQPWLSCGALSEVAGSMMHRVLRKRDYAGLSDFFGDGAAFLAAGGHAASMFSVLLAVDPLKQDVQQKVTAENTKREEHRKRHADLTRTGLNG